MKLFIFIVLFSLYHTIRISPLDRSEVKSDNIGSHIYNTLVVTQSMKRPNKNWFFNVFSLKPSEKYFQNAQYNGLRYQTELLRENINNNYLICPHNICGKCYRQANRVWRTPCGCTKLYKNRFSGPYRLICNQRYRTAGYNL